MGMVKRWLLPLLVLPILLLAACGGGSEATRDTAEPAAPGGDKPVVTVFRPPT